MSLVILPSQTAFKTTCQPMKDLCYFLFRCTVNYSIDHLKGKLFIVIDVDRGL